MANRVDHGFDADFFEDTGDRHTGHRAHLVEFISSIARSRVVAAGE
jgi:hypothetical protein